MTPSPLRAAWPVGRLAWQPIIPAEWQPIAYLGLVSLALALLGATLLLRRRQSRRALLRRLSELSALAELGRAISQAQMDLNRLAEVIFAHASQIVETRFFQLGLFEGDRYRILVWQVDGERRPPAEFRLTPASLGIMGWVRESRQSLLVRDFEREAEQLPARPRYQAPNPPRSAVFVPLLVGEATRGVIAVQSRSPHAFSEEHLRLLSIVGNHAAAALEQARLFEQAQRRANQLELLSSVSRHINVLQPLSSLYQQIVALVAETYNEYQLAFYEQRGAGLRLCAQSAPPDGAEAAPWPSLPAEVQAEPPAGQEPGAPGASPSSEGASPIGLAAAQQQTVSAAHLPELADHPEVGEPEAGAWAELAVPVVIDGRVLGVLDVRARPDAIGVEGVKAVFQALAAQMAMAILEAQVYAAEQQRAEHLAALAQAARVVTSNLELDDVLDEVLDVVDERFGYKSARIFLLNEDRLVYAAGAGEGAVGQSIEGLAYPLDGPGLIARVGRSGEPAVVADVTEDPDYVVGPGLATTRAEMAAPLMMGNRLLGVFDVQADRPGAFDEADARSLQTLADTLAVAVRNARLFEHERRRRRLAEIMREVSAALTSTLHLDEVLDTILDGLALVVSYDAASILLVNDAGEMVLRAARGAPGAEAALGLPLAVTVFPPGSTVPAVLPFQEVDTKGEYHDLVALPEPHACLAAPLVPGGEHLGYLAVEYAGQNRFGAAEVELITTFAAQAAVAIENARLYTAQREQAWISTALLQVAEATAVSTELSEVLTTVARLTPMLVGVDRCAVLLAPEVPAEERAVAPWRMVAYSGSGDNRPDGDVPALFAGGLGAADWRGFQEMLSTHEPVVLDPADELPENLREIFVGVVILLPLLAKGVVEGALVVGQVPGETPFTTHRVRLMSGIANQAALAIEGAMLFAAQQEEAWVNTALLQVAESVAGQPLDVAMELIGRLTPMLVGIERLAIYQWDPAQHSFLLRYAAGLSPEAEERLRAQTVSVHSLGLEPDAELFGTTPPWSITLPPELADPFGCARCHAWPLRARGEAAGPVFGVLAVEAVPLPGRRVAILNGIAYQLATAMENARLAQEVAAQQRLERELELGRDIQASFLPQSLPEAPGWGLAALWRSARQVGGDFYDFIPLRAGPDGARWGLVIADVADKGVPAALYMALCRTLLRTVAINRVSPADTLRRVNQLILSDARSDQFVTVFYAVWEPATGNLWYALGGHNPPVWFRSSGEVRPLPGRGMALGVLDTADYQGHSVMLEPGDGLVLYTDGLPDAINAHLEEFGSQRVVAEVREASALPATALLRSLEAAVDAHVGKGETFDDMTVVVLKREGERREAGTETARPE